MKKELQISTTTIRIESVQEFLGSYFGSVIRSRGKRLFDSGAIKSYVLEEDTLFALVLGSRPYSVEMMFDRGHLHYSNCTCPYESYCKHEAALAYFIIEESNKSAEEIQAKKITSRSNLKSRKSNELAPLPTIKGLTINQVVEKLAPRSERWQSDLFSEHRIISSTQLESTIYESDWNGNKEIGAVTICKKNKKILVQCQACSEMAKSLCRHQYAALRDFLSSAISHDWQNGRYDFDTHISSLAKQYGMNGAHFIENFDVCLKNEGLFVKMKRDGLLLDLTKVDLQQMVRGEMNLSQDASEDSQLRIFERRIQYKNAFVWHPYLDHGDDVISIVEGKTNKDQSKLSSHIKEVEKPKYLSKSSRQFLQGIAGISKLSEVENDWISTLEIFKSNRDVLDANIHFRLERDRFGFYGVDIRKKDLTKIVFAKDLIKVKIRTSIEKDLIVLEALLSVEERNIKFEDIIFLNRFFLCDLNNQAYLFQEGRDLKAVRFFKDKPKFVFFLSEKDKFLQFWELLSKHFVVETDLPFVVEKQVAKVKKQVYLKESESVLQFQPVVTFKGGKIRGFDSLLVKPTKSGVTSYQVKPEIVQEFRSELQQMHSSWATDRSQNNFFLSIDDVAQDLWFLKFVEQCKLHNIEIFGQENLSKFKYSPHRAKVNTSVKSGIDWFDVDVAIQFGDEQLTAKDWLAAVKNNSRFIKLGDDSIGVLPEAWFTRLQKLAKNISLVNGETKVSKLQFNVIDELFQQRDFDLEVLEEIKLKKEKLAQYKKKKTYRIPSVIKADLRSYQEAGFKWLKFLQEFQFGGCLADDMGLGKTLQAICVLAEQRTKGQSLVIVPRTLLFNWAAEIDKFCPVLKYVIHHGPQRAMSTEQFEGHHIVVSTYDTVASDIEFMSEKEWRYLILDESQAIKNPSSKRYRAMCLLRGKFKLVMTGTPIENSTFDLFAQMSFVNPGFLGNAAAFKKDYVLPIERDGHQGIADQLQKMVHPFVLRRTKSQVAKDLPAKTESILWCEMGKAQRIQYDSLKKQIRDQVYDKINKDGVAKSKFMVLEGLLRLRQMCNAPALIDQNLSETDQQSVKIDNLMQQITGDLADHSTLIFSQFVGMLQLIKERLEAANVAFAYLDGSTRNREEAVRQFNDEEDRRIFLISLKAGNTGLNLVKADYVYLVDPWWNPAVEAQAIDRTHRIGQDKHIFAYKMICKDTIEEKIVELQNKKKKLASDIIQTDANVFKSLNKTDLMALFD